MAPPTTMQARGVRSRQQFYGTMKPSASAPDTSPTTTTTATAAAPISIGFRRAAASVVATERAVAAAAVLAAHGTRHPVALEQSPRPRRWHLLPQRSPTPARSTERHRVRYFPFRSVPSAL